MDNFKNTPASMRYLGARLKPFRRPLFWGSIGLVGLIGFALYEYWQHPDWISGNLSEIPNTNNGSASRLSTLNSQGEISAEDLAIGAELDNVDLLLKELEQTQTLPLSETLKQQNKDRNSITPVDKGTAYQRFQEKQKSKLTRSPDPLFPDGKNANNLVESPTRGIFELPKTNGYNSIVPPPPTVETSDSSNRELIPNPVGRLYLSSPNRLGSTTTTTTPSSSVNLPSPVTQTPATTNGETANAPTVPNGTAEVNPGLTNTFVTPSLVPYSNNINVPPTTPTPGYGQPLYPSSANVGSNGNVNINSPINTLPTRFQADNRQQTQSPYQLSPSSYQLQPQTDNGSNVNTGFNSQPNTFVPSNNFGTSSFENNR